MDNILSIDSIAPENTNENQNIKSIYKSIEDLPLCLSVANVATALNISRTNAYTLVHSKTFPKLKIGSRMIVPKDAFVRWIESQLATN